jgi:3-dehydroquinate synthase
MRHYFLYGPSGAGKSTVGERLAGRLSLPFFDLDAAIENAGNERIPEIFARIGERGFREIERRVLTDLVGRPGESVIALGGGALLDPENRELAEAAGLVLCLHAAPAELARRLQADPNGRPLLQDDFPASLNRYLDQRAAHYDSFPTRLDSTGLTADEAAGAAAQTFGVYRVNGMGHPYDVRFRDGLFAEIPELLRSRGLAGPYALVADDNTAWYARLVAGGLDGPAEIVTIEPGESNKTMAAVEALWAAFLDAGLERGSTVLAVGGGVVGDLAGFAAATYLRGMAWVAVPTSLLAMVDASLGGKTGADLPQGKNLVGAFHPPGLVAADPSALATLPEIELRSGMAEVVKAGLIGDPVLFDLCRDWTGGPPPGDWIVRSMDVKIRTIEADPYEKGRRGVLNLGHTIGHAVEHASGYKLRHGEAVAVGMAVEATLAERLGIAENGTAERVCDCLDRIGLPTTVPVGLDRDRILASLSLDKKKRGGRLRFALLKRIGEVELVEMDLERVREFLG